MQRFSIFPNCEIIKGSVPKALSSVEIDSCCFLHLDMNSWEAEIAALDFFMPKMTRGGVIVLDDFGLYTHSSQARFELPYFQKRELPILELPTGQGVVFIN